MSWRSVRPRERRARTWARPGRASARTEGLGYVPPSRPVKRRDRGRWGVTTTVSSMPDKTSSSAPRRVVLTGAGGHIGQAVSGRLGDRWDLQLTDRRDVAEEAGLETLDVTDLEACAAAFADADAVVHLAANPSPDATFSELLAPNLVAPYAVATAAVQAGVRRLVLASSLHA